MVENRNRFIGLLHPFFVCIAYLFLYLPIIVMVLFSFNDSEVSAHWTGFSLRWYRHLVNSPELLQAFKASMIIACASTVLSVAAGTCFVVASNICLPRFFNNIFYANIMLPEIVLAVGILSVFTYFKISLGYGSLIIGHTLLGMGFVIPIIRARYVELDPVLTEASMDLGATYFQTLRKVVVPLLLPSLIASGLIVFTLSLDDFLISFFCSGSSVQTLSTFVYSKVQSIVDPSINALSACLLLASSILVFLLSAFNVVDQVIGNE